MESYRSPLLSLPGATELPDAGTSLIDAAGVAWHYGDPLREQRLIERGGAVIDRSHRRVIRVAGPDVAVFLNNLLSQKLIDVPSPFSASALDLDMQGRILHHADVTAENGEFFLDVPSYSGDTFVDFLTKMIFWSDVTVEEVDLGILTVLGASASVDSAAFTRTVDWRGPQRTDIAVPRDQLRSTVDSLTATGLARAGLMAFTAERIKALEPELRVDLDAKSIPHEAPTLIARGGHLGAVHLDKGCYRGQETVARVENLGRSPRLLVLVHIDGSAPVEPQPGAPITAPGSPRPVGRLGSVVHDCDYGPVGLALIKRSALDTGEQVEIIAGDEQQEVAVSASIDPDSIPVDEGEHAGRVAVDKLRGKI